MRKIIMDLAVTLDGFIEGPNGEIDWCILDAETGSGLLTFLEEIDTIFYGRTSYERWGQYQPTADASEPEKQLWSAVHSKEKVVFSTHHKGDGTNAVFINKDISREVNNFKNKPGKNIWLYGGAGLISSFLELDLVDELRLAVHPVVLGQGKPLFPRTDHRLNLKLKEVQSAISGVVQLKYVR
jgi:dihydrofolate reductase